MKVLILGATGMLGSAVLRIMHDNDSFETIGSIRATEKKTVFEKELRPRLRVIADLENLSDIVFHFKKIRPDVVINCIALRRGPDGVIDFRRLIALLALLPQRLSMICSTFGCRLIQISSDGVFSGLKGNYTEKDYTDASDAYGIAKILGELRDSHTVTIRTSIIGHELTSQSGLLEWFLAQDQPCRGYTKAIFSGLPTVVLAKIIRDVIIPNQNLSGVYHIASEAISKYDLLSKIATIYQKSIKIIPDDQLIIDRSLATDKFTAATGYVTPPWGQLIQLMHASRDPKHV